MAYWLAGAAILFAVEIFIGSVYLLVLSASLVGAGLASWLFDSPWQIPFWVASILSVIGIYWVYTLRKQHPTTDAIISANDLDIGATVILQDRLPNGNWHVHYRGAQWEARLCNEDINASTGNSCCIVGKDGIILLLKQ